MLDRQKKYKRPMKEFLNSYMKANRHLGLRSKDSMVSIFMETTNRILHDIGPNAFRLKKTINAAVAESVMYAVASGIERGDLEKSRKMKAAFSALLGDPNYTDAVTRSTADEENVRQRLELATKAFRL
jgi:hypothetical protein